jgi:hypothetical protein
MENQLDRFKKDLKKLEVDGTRLEMSMRRGISKVAKEEFDASVKKQLKDKADDFIKSLPTFDAEYQRRYSEALALLRQILPDRVADFTRLYEKPKSRKEITYDNYVIEDYLHGLRVTRLGDVVVGKDAAIPRMEQQCSIVKAAAARFDSSLFDIRRIVHADLLDSETAVAKELNNHKFTRAAGAVAGVVLERHLREVCQDRGFKFIKKNPTIADFNETLKSEGVIDVPTWRFVQHLADIRNLCDYSKDPEPTKEQVSDMIIGVERIIKSVF